MNKRLHYLTTDENLYIRPPTFSEQWLINGKEKKDYTYIGFVCSSDLVNFFDEFKVVMALKNTDIKKKKLDLLDLIGKFDYKETDQKGCIVEYIQEDQKQNISRKNVKEIRLS